MVFGRFQKFNIFEKIITYPILGLFITALFAPSVAVAYGPTTTHAALSDEIVDFYNISFPEKPLSPQIKEWIVEGSILEDTPPRWTNHLYDPIHNIGWDGKKLGVVDPELVRMFTFFAFTPEKILSAKDWVNNEAVQETYGRYGGNRTWRQALRYYADGNLEEAYKTLGFALHLLEDVSVPEHTRNDPHPHSLEAVTGETGSPFEEYLKRWTRSTLTSVATDLSKRSVAPLEQNSIEDYIDSLARYSNKYFFSKDTINDSDYESPKILSEDGNFGYGVDEHGEFFPLVAIDKFLSEEKTILKTYSIQDQKEYYPILDAYFDRLSKKTVLHGAGAIDLFHKQAEEAVINKDFPNHLVQFNTKPFTFNIISPIGESYRIAGFINSAKSAVASILGTIGGAIDFISDKIALTFAGGKSEISSTMMVVSDSDPENQAISVIKAVEETERKEVSPLTPAMQSDLDDIFDKAVEISNKLNSPKTKETEVTKATIKNIPQIYVSLVSTASGVSTPTATNNSSSGSQGSTNDNSASETAPTSTQSSSSSVSHVVISEIQVAGIDAGDEFVEIYNPTDSAVDMSSWSIQYVSGSAGEVSGATVSRKNFVDENIIPAKGFFLIARSLNSGGADGYDGSVVPDMSHRSFSLSGASAGAKIFIVSNQEDVEGLNDADIVDFVDYSFGVPDSGGSLERRAYVDASCVEAAGDGELLGNGCDTDQNSDFVSRAISSPQGTSSLIEPRSLLVITNVSSSYSAEDFIINITWDDVPGKNTYQINKIEGVVVTYLGASNASNFSFSPNEVGLSYELGVRVIDAEGFLGPVSSTTIFIPTFLSQIDFYRDSTSSSGDYLIDLSSDEFPFVPDPYWDLTDTTWKAVVIHLNSDPEPQELLTNTNGWQATSSNSLAVKYNQCAGNFSAGTSILIPDTVSSCGVGGGLMNSALDFSHIEDNRLRVVLASSTSDLVLAGSDYITLAFYSFYQSGGGQQILKLVAVDRTKRYFSDLPPTSLAPNTPGDLAASYDSNDAKILLSWLPSEDSDSFDEDITYSISVNNSDWELVTLETGADPLRQYFSFSANPGADYSIDLIARDDRGNISPSANVLITTPLQPAPFGVSNMHWGSINGSSAIELSFGFGSYPFISNGGFFWYGMIFYLNQDPPLTHSFNLEAADADIAGSNNILSLTYPSCASPTESAIALFMAEESLSPGLCSRRRQLFLDSPQFYFSTSTSEGSITVGVQGESFSPTDYITVGFYNTNGFGFPAGTFNLVARDLNKYYFTQ